MSVSKLRILNTEMSGREFVLPDGPAVLGRGAGSDVLLSDPSVSRSHVRVEVQDGRCLLTDLGSQSGILVGGRSVREASLAAGEQFELGDVRLEFILEETRDTGEEPVVGAAPPVPRTQPAEPAPPGGLPAERPVLVDDLFGRAGAPGLGPGAEEKAAAAGARGALKYVGVLALLLAAGALAWHVASAAAREQNVKPVFIQAGETQVIDLGIRTRQEPGRLVTYYDEGETYDHWEYAEPAGEEVARFELDKTGFMATVEGLIPGETDIELFGRRNRRATVRILVRGSVPRAVEADRLGPEERVRRAKLLVAGAGTARQAGHLYRATQTLRKAYALLEPVKTPEGLALRNEADRQYQTARETLDKKFDDIKSQALFRYKAGDDRGAYKAWEELRHLVPDEDDEMNQKLAIILRRTLDQIRREGG